MWCRQAFGYPWFVAFCGRSHWCTSGHIFTSTRGYPYTMEGLEARRGNTGRKWTENSHWGEKCDYSKMNFCQLYVTIDHFWPWLWLKSFVDIYFSFLSSALQTWEKSINFKFQQILFSTFFNILVYTIWSGTIQEKLLKCSENWPILAQF